jgi:hypothetical protein
MPYIDSRIPLAAAQPLPTVDPVEQYGKMLSLKSMLNQGQMQQEQLAAAKLSREEAERSIAEEQALRSEIAKNPNLSESDAYRISGKRGLEYFKSLFENRRVKNEAIIKQWEALKPKRELLGNVATELQLKPAEQRAALYPAMRQMLLASGQFTQEELDESPDLSDASLSALRLVSNDVKAWVDLQNAIAAEKRAGETQNMQRQTNAVNEMRGVAQLNETARHNKAVEERQALPNTPTELAVQASGGDPNKALGILEKHAIAQRPVTNVTTGAPGSSPDDPKAIAQAIINGLQPPTLTGLYRGGFPVRAELARRGFNMTVAQRDWDAIKRHLSTLNGPQQERLKQAVNFTYDSLDQIESLYKEWTAKGFNTRFKAFNKASLAAAKQAGGEAGSIAQVLEAQINDLTSELGTVYKGGNASTDESLRLASENLKSDWNELTFRRALEQIRKNLQIRRNSIITSTPTGVSQDSRYLPTPPVAAPPPGGQSKATHRFNPATGKIEAIK